MAADVRMLTPDDWQTYRTIRLEALLDAPSAFGSTHAGSLEFTEEDWRRRLSSPIWLTETGGRPTGTIGAFSEHPGVVEVVGMWVRPAARGTGVAGDLVGALIDWAGRSDPPVKTVHLWVTETNQAGRRLYERWSFTYTGQREPLISNTTLNVLGMERQL